MSYCQGKKFKVLISLPIVSPAKVRWHWGDEQWQEIEADDYDITNTYPGNTYYMLGGTYRRKWYPTGDPRDETDPNCGDDAYWMSRYPCNTVQVQNDEIYWWGGSNSAWSYTRAIVDCSLSQAQTLNPNYHPSGYLKYRAINDTCIEGSTSQLYGDSFNILYTRAVYWGSGSRYYDATPLDYTLEIYNQEQLVHDETQTSEPTVELIEESTIFHPNGWLILIEGENPLGVGIDIIENADLSISVRRDGSEIARASTTPESSFYPQYEVKCLRQCPGNTCAVQCGDIICCYNDQGVVVESIKQDEYDF